MAIMTNCVGLAPKHRRGRGSALRLALRVCCTCLTLFFYSLPCVFANTLRVGPNEKFTAPCAAIAAASDGDTIEIDSSVVYRGDVCRFAKNNLTLRGVGDRRAVLLASGKAAEAKAIWVIAGNDTTVENIEFAGAKVPDLNGAGIRQEGANLTVRNCYFHHDQDGILTGTNPSSTITIEYSEFASNGAGDGQSHNLYIGNVKKLIFQFNYSHDAIVGHLLKSRAVENYIAYNMLADGFLGNPSYELDLPNGGKSIVLGNLIEQSLQSQNDNILAYMEEGDAPGNPSHDLYVVNNTFVNDYGKGIFVYIGAEDDKPALIQNNIFAGQGVITNQPRAVKLNNSAGYVDFVDRGNLDYHLKPHSGQGHAGSTPHPREGLDPNLLIPEYQYLANACGESRSPSSGPIDLGGYSSSPLPPASSPPPNSPPRCNKPASK
jgi:Right handed beta helix region